MTSVTLLDTPARLRRQDLGGVSWDREEGRDGSQGWEGVEVRKGKREKEGGGRRKEVGVRVGRKEMGVQKEVGSREKVGVSIGKKEKVGCQSSPPYYVAELLIPSEQVGPI